MLTYLKAWIESQFKSEEGAAMVEYALLVALIAVVAIVATTSVGTAVVGKFEEIVTGLGG